MERQLNIDNMPDFAQLHHCSFRGSRRNAEGMENQRINKCVRKVQKRDFINVNDGSGRTHQANIKWKLKVSHWALLNVSSKHLGRRSAGSMKKTKACHVTSTARFRPSVCLSFCPSIHLSLGFQWLSTLHVVYLLWILSGNIRRGLLGFHCLAVVDYFPLLGSSVLFQHNKAHFTNLNKIWDFYYWRNVN